MPRSKCWRGQTDLEEVAERFHQGVRPQKAPGQHRACVLRHGVEVRDEAVRVLHIRQDKSCKQTAHTPLPKNGMNAENHPVLTVALLGAEVATPACSEITHQKFLFQKHYVATMNMNKNNYVSMVTPSLSSFL